MNNLEIAQPGDFDAQIETLKLRFNKEYRHQPFDLPEEVEAMPLFREWIDRSLVAKTASSFWELAKFSKNQRCLDIGCGVSFLIYPWREWEVFFYGQEISTVATEALNSRGSQLNSKLFKGVKLGPAHQLLYDDAMFDRAIATGVSCYFDLAYWQLVLQEVKRILKPDGVFVFDAIDPEAAIAENWAILEMYLGAEVFLTPLTQMQDLVTSMGGKIEATRPGELFRMYQVRFSNKFVS